MEHVSTYDCVIDLEIRVLPNAEVTEGEYRVAEFGRLFY